MSETVLTNNPLSDEALENWLLLREVVAQEGHYKEKGVHFNMRVYQFETSCGTACCLAGSILFAKGKDTVLYKNGSQIANEAALLLGLDPMEHNGNKGLFDAFATFWPTDLRERYRSAAADGNQEEMKAAGLALIDRVICQEMSRRKIIEQQLEEKKCQKS